MKFKDLFESEEDKKIVLSSGIIALILTALFTIFVFVYTALNP